MGERGAEQRIYSMELVDAPHLTTLQWLWSLMREVSGNEFVLTTVLPFSFLIGSYVLFNLPLTFLEWMRFKPLQKYKIQEDVYISPAENRHCLLMLARNYLGTMAPMVMLAYPLFRLLFSISMEDVPLWWEVVLQCAAFAVIEDTTHYFVHWLLHIPVLYEKIHSVHHRYSAPSGICASYAHPLEIILLGMATFLGPILFMPHMITFLIWVNVRQLLAIETHCGYDFPWSPNNLLPSFFGGADFHDFHHRTYNGAFSSTFVWWDELLGTDNGYLKYKAQQEAKGVHVKSGDFKDVQITSAMSRAALDPTKQKSNKAD